LNGALTAVVLIMFLQRLIRDAECKVFLIMDRLPVHRAAAVKAWLAQHRSQIKVYYLPPYSPGLNPDEGINGDIKRSVTAKSPARSRAELKRNLICHMRKLSRLPKRIESFCGAQPTQKLCWTERPESGRSGLWNFQRRV
jgi:transposase